MTSDTPDRDLDESVPLDDTLRAALGPPAAPDFDAWRTRHAEALAHLNPVATALRRRRRNWLMRTTKPAAVAALSAALIWFLIPERPSFAQAAKVIEDAKTVTWTVTSYERHSDKNGRTWLVRRPSKIAYRHPGLFRKTDYDDQGNEALVTIIDSRTQQFLALNVKKKQTSPDLSYQVFFHPDGPFGWVADVLRTKPLEQAGQRQVDGKTVNVFRFRQAKMPGPRNSRDLWLDPETKRLVGHSDPGADVFDPETTPDRNNPPGKFAMATILGSITRDIAFDVELDPSLFSLTAPPGYEVVAPPEIPPVTEGQMAEWLGLMARVNGDKFPANAHGIHDAVVRAAVNKAGYADLRARGLRPPEQPAEATGDPTDAERKLADALKKYRAFRHNPPGGFFNTPLDDFIAEQTSPGSFRYVGHGVPLGAADRFVCWYRLKGKETWHAVSGDLTVKEVAPNDLPLPVAN